MQTGFSDPIKIKDPKKKKNPWSFECPPYDERSSCFVNAGTHYGAGHRQPVGHKGDPKDKVAVLPTDLRGIKTMEVSEVYQGKPGLFETEIDE